MAMGGVGEAMLLGAAMGGGSAALTGGDPLKGALLGGLTGGAGAGISGALGGAAGTAGTLGTEAALSTLGADAATNTVMANALPASNMIANPIATSGFTPIPAGQSFAQASQLANTTSGVNAAMNQALPLTGNLGSAGISGLPAASTSPFLPTPPPVAPPVAPPRGPRPPLARRGSAAAGVRGPLQERLATHTASARRPGSQVDRRWSLERASGHAWPRHRLTCG